MSGVANDGARGSFPTLPVLVVDDDAGSAQGLQIALKSMGYSNLEVCHDGAAAAKRLVQAEFEFVLLDLVMPGMCGEQVLDTTLGVRPEVPIIVVTAMDELDTAVKCMRAGAFDYLVKPVSRERLFASVQRATEVRNLRRENARLKERVLSNALNRPETFAAFDTTNARMLALFRYVETIAGSPDPVLITGETGVGKEIMARCIHALSGRRGELVAVNVAGLDAHAFSDTLFGHRKGAFTGASEQRSGLVERAAGGTLFLDEIGDLDMELQVKLLRLLQEREYFSIGADIPRRSDSRVVVATNRPIEELHTSDRFRKDLYFRLCSHRVHIPPLRERLEDLPLLAERLMTERACRDGGARRELSPGALAVLRQYDFPGNVRELRAMLNETAAQHPHGGPLPASLFTEWIRRHRGVGMPLDDGSEQTAKDVTQVVPGKLPTLREAQKQLVEEALRRSKGNQAVAARTLGITRQALNRRLAGKRCGVETAT